MWGSGFDTISELLTSDPERSTQNVAGVGKGGVEAVSKEAQH